MDGLTESERTLLDAIATSGPDGSLLSALRASLAAKGFDQRQTGDALRTLLTSAKISVTRSTNVAGDHVVTLKRPQMSENFTIVLSVVRSAGPSGIDVAALASRTKVPKPEITKALNAFVQQQSVRETRCFTNKAKKLYIAAEFEPSAEVTGGTFYTESRDLDTALIDLARQRITSYIASAGSANVSRLKVQLDSDPRLAQRRMSLAEVGTVARTLQLDGVLKRQRTPGQDAALHDVADRTYTLSGDRQDVGRLGVRCNRLSEQDAWAAMFPCTSCPQLMSCEKRGIVTPLTCAYLSDWLTVPSTSSSSGGKKGGGAGAAAAAAEEDEDGGDDLMRPPSSAAGAAAAGAAGRLGRVSSGSAGIKDEKGFDLLI